MGKAAPQSVWTSRNVITTLFSFTYKWFRRCQFLCSSWELGKGCAFAQLFHSIKKNSCILNPVGWNIKTAGLNLEEGKSLSSYLLILHWAQTYIMNLSFGTWEVQGCTASMAPERRGSNILKKWPSLTQTTWPDICLLCAAPVLPTTMTDQGWVLSVQDSRRRFDNTQQNHVPPPWPARWQRKFHVPHFIGLTLIEVL